jgi:hypothetical protein
MKERPILFSAPMVRAILDGRKTMTRRVVKPQPIKQHYIAYVPGGAAYNCAANEGQFEVMTRYATHVKTLECPYGVPGDRLWVRETWATDLHLDQFAPSTFRPCDNFRKLPAILHAADVREKLNTWGKWRSARFMPRWASRITLEITAVRVERVQEITEVDAIAEGCNRKVQYVSETDFVGSQCRKHDFANLWNDINLKRGFGWAVNPWVWVVEFRRVT